MDNLDDILKRSRERSKQLKLLMDDNSNINNAAAKFTQLKQQKIGEQQRAEEEKKVEEEKQKADQLRKPEEHREAEEKRRADENRKAEEQREADKKRKGEEQYLMDEQRNADKLYGILHHSISFCRREERQRHSSAPPPDCNTTELSIPTPLTPMKSCYSVVNNNGDTPALSYSSALDATDSTGGTVSNEAVLKNLHEAIIVQQDQISQASRALLYCQSNGFRGTREEVDAQRALLLANEKKRALLYERDRIISLEQRNDTLKKPSEELLAEPRGTLTFCYVAVRLSRDFINLYIRQNEDCNRYYFIVLIKHKEQVLHTHLADSTDAVKSGFVEYLQYMDLSGLTPDYECQLEVFALRANKYGGGGVSTSGTEKSKKTTAGCTVRKLVGAPFNCKRNSPYNSWRNGMSSTSSIIGVCSTPTTYPRSSTPTAAGTAECAFIRIGYMRLTRGDLGKEKFFLSEALYPLDGTIVLKMRCLAEKVEIPYSYNGFLSKYQMVSGFGQWSRLWCILDDKALRFWRHPQEEHKQPLETLELSRCASKMSEVCGMMSTYPNSVQIEVYEMKDKNNENKENEEMTSNTRKILFAADTHEAMCAWMEVVNRAIHNANVWTTSHHNAFNNDNDDVK